MEPIHIKPAAKHFIIQAVIVPSFQRIIGTLIFGIIAGINIFNNTFQAILFAILISVLFFFVGIIINAISNFFIYRKTRYEIYPNKIVWYTGTLFSDKKQELLFSNVTALTQIDPLFLRPFNNGSIVLDSAGSLEDTIIVVGLNNPDKYFAMFSDKLRANGYRMQMQIVIDQQFTSKNQMILAATIYPFIALAISTTIFFAIFVSLTDSFLIIALLYLLFISATVAQSVIKYFDYKNRVYTVYDDGVEYYEGFLTKIKSILPMEKISNSTRKQGILDRLFGFATLHISTIGSGRDLDFAYIPRSEEMVDALNNQIEDYASIVKSVAQQVVQSDDSIKSDSEAIATDLDTDRKSEELTFNRTDYVASFKPDLVRGSIGWFIILPFTFIFPIFTIIWAFAYAVFLTAGYFTTYHVEKGYFAENFKFIVVSEKKANVDKITTVTVNRTFIDRLIGLCTIKIISLGTADNIICRKVTYDLSLIEEIRRKVGMDFTEEIHNEELVFSLWNYITKNIFGFVIGLIILTVITFSILLIPNIPGSARAVLLLMLIVFSIFVYFIKYLFEYLSYKGKALQYFQNGLYMNQGFLMQEMTSVRYKNIKGVKTLHYPISTSGNLVLNIAGEQLTQNGNNNQQVLRSVDLQIPYFPEIKKADELIDFLLIYLNQGYSFEKISELVNSYKPEIIALYKPSYLPTTLVFVLFAFVFPPILVFLPISYLFIYFRSYQMEATRILVKSGIIYKSQHSIIHSRIDFIGKLQQLLGKLTGTGLVSINTVGSSTTEMTLGSLKQYNELYELIQEKYKVSGKGDSPEGK